MTRNRTSIGKPSVHRGNDGSLRAFTTHTIANNPRNEARDSRFTVRVVGQNSRWRHAMYQRLSKSAARSLLNRKNVHHALGAAIANGRFTRSHAPAVDHASPIARSGRRSRRRCTISGSASIPG